MRLLCHVDGCLFLLLDSHLRKCLGITSGVESSDARPHSKCFTLHDDTVKISCFPDNMGGRRSGGPAETQYTCDADSQVVVRMGILSPSQVHVLVGCQKHSLESSLGRRNCITHINCWPF